jgi:hypothetical protein
MLRFNHRKNTWEVFGGCSGWLPCSWQWARDNCIFVEVEETVA